MSEHTGDLQDKWTRRGTFTTEAQIGLAATYISQLQKEKEELRLECNRLYGIGQEYEAENAALKQALTLISDIGYDYDGYGTPHDLKKLIDEMVGYARNPQSAVDALTAEEQE